MILVLDYPFQLEYAKWSFTNTIIKISTGWGSYQFSFFGNSKLQWRLNGIILVYIYVDAPVYSQLCFGYNFQSIYFQCGWLSCTCIFTCWTERPCRIVRDQRPPDLFYGPYLVACSDLDSHSIIQKSLQIVTTELLPWSRVSIYTLSGFFEGIYVYLNKTDTFS